MSQTFGTRTVRCLQMARVENSVRVATKGLKLVSRKSRPVTFEKSLNHIFENIHDPKFLSGLTRICSKIAHLSTREPVGLTKRVALLFLVPSLSRGSPLPTNHLSLLLGSFSPPLPHSSLRLYGHSPGTLSQKSAGTPPTLPHRNLSPQSLRALPHRSLRALPHSSLRALPRHSPTAVCGHSPTALYCGGGVPVGCCGTTKTRFFRRLRRRALTCHKSPIRGRIFFENQGYAGPQNSDWGSAGPPPGECRHSPTGPSEITRPVGI